MKNKLPITIGVLALITIILTLTNLTFLESLRITLGTPYVLFLPGYVISFIFFKKIDIIERIALSFALSIAIVPLIIFYLNLIGMKINLLNSILTITGIIIASIAIRALLILKKRKTISY